LTKPSLKNIKRRNSMKMKFPKYVKTTDGFVGVFKRLEFNEFPIYRFDGGERVADDWELEHGSNNRENLE
jgi:hypothetical protein